MFAPFGFSRKQVQKVYFAKFKTESLRIVRARDGSLVGGVGCGVVLRNPVRGARWAGRVLD